MRRKYLKLIIFIISYPALVYFNFINPFTYANEVNNPDIEITEADASIIRMSPTYLSTQINAGNSQSFIIKFENIEINAYVLSYEIYQSDKDFRTSSKYDGNIVSLSKIESVDEALSEFDISINATNLNPGEAYFLVRFVLEGKNGENNLNSKLEFLLPISIKVIPNEKMLSEVKPVIIIEGVDNYILTTNDKNIKVKIQNPMDYEVKINSEIIFVDSKEETFYSEPLTIAKTFNPKEIYEAEIAFPQLPQKTLPYTGKVKIFINGNINNEKHFQSEAVKTFIIPSVYFLLTSLLIILTILAIGLRKYRLNKVKYSILSPLFKRRL